MVEIYVKPELRDKIKKLKREATYHEFLENLIEKQEFSSQSDPGGKSPCV